MIRAVIIDDEKDSVEFIHSIINEYTSDIDVVGEAYSVKQGTALIRKEKPELLFLDVEMPAGTGVNLLENFTEKDCHVIFITAFNHYGIQAIKFSAIDYILKPIHIKEFLEAIEKVNEIIAPENNISNRLSALMENLHSASPVKIAVASSSGIEYVVTNNIIRIEADRCYSTLHLKEGNNIIVSRNLGEFQELLLDKNFSRPHHSHLINLAYVKKYIRADGGSILMTDGSYIPVSKSKKELFLAKMANYSR